MSETQPAGPGVDAEGRTVTDPSINVRELVVAEVRRIDDLRELTAKYINERITEEARCNERLADLRAAHDRELRAAEAERINAIRAVDVAASQQATKDAEVRASALAKQVSDTSEAARSQVAAAASAQATSLRAELAPIQEQLAQLTQRMYEQQGQKTQVIEGRADRDDFAPVLAAIEKLTQANAEAIGARSQVVERRAQVGSTQAIIGTGLAILAAAGLYLGTRNPEPVVVTPPVTVTVERTP